MDETPFVERSFELDGGSLVFRFFAPFRASTGEFKCRWSVAWPDQEVGRHTHGEDGVQALMLATRTVHTELRESDAYKAGRLSLYGQQELGLPPAF